MAGLALVSYVLLAYYASILPPDEGKFSVAIALLPYFVVAAVLAWRSRHRVAWLLLCLGIATLTWRYLDAIGDYAAWLYFVQHASGNAIMAMVFGISLGRDSVPLCSRIAAMTHGPLDQRVARYTRNVTQAWTIFFVGMAGTSVVLFAFAPLMLWSVFANLLSLPLVALMFAGEYVVRLRFLPDIKHVTLLEGIRLYRRSLRAAPPPIA